jgi:L-fuconolactonase
VPRFDSAEVRTLLDWLIEHGRTLDLGVHPHEMAGAVEVLAKYPQLNVVVEHADWPLGGDIQDPIPGGKDSPGWPTWVRVRCKISGLPMAIGAFEPARLRPWVLTVVGLFGPGRPMLGSSFPVDNAVGGYRETIGSYYEVLKELGAEALDHIFVGAASRFYGISADQDPAE